MAAGVSLTQIVLVALLLAAILYYVDMALKQQFVRDARLTTKTVAASVAPMTDAKNISAMLSAIRTGKVVYAEVVRADGKHVGNPPSTMEDGLVYAEDQALGMHGDAVYFVTAPLQGGGNTAAELRLGFDEHAISMQRQQIASFMMILLLVYALVGPVLIFLVGKRVMSPLNELRRALANIREGYVVARLDVASPVTDVRDLVTHFDAMRTELAKRTTELGHQAMHDVLTGLPNGVLLEDRIRQSMLARSGKPAAFALLLINLDCMQELNDTEGAQVCSEVLCMAGRRLKRVVRQGDTVARMGGDKFAVMLNGVNKDAGVAIKIIQQEMQREFQVGDHVIDIHAFIGVSYFTGAAQSIEDLMQQAEKAMNEAKLSGKPVVTYSGKG